MNANTPAKARTLRCAIYTRKSSEEGLEQSFNSLHAQREACEAYIKSQAHEGWTCLAAAYDDGGFSGGSMDRPGLQALLDDIASGRIDVVVVYKVDRLTRSLTDFAKIVDAFDAKGVSFVSVTQAFNTTTSMGRLTLNVLLSFAQFEREVTGERIRDKIAASKAKGMWMGGNLPLGYDAGDHTLVVNEVEAEQVRFIFQRYLKLGSVYLLRDELERRGLRSKAWISKSGSQRGGAVFGHGALFHLLQNRHYLGEICHRDKTYPGQHAAIVDAKLFEAVQEKLEANRITRRAGSKRTASARLVGRIFSADGTPMTPTSAYGQHGKLYRYYVAAPLLTGGKPNDDAPRRLPGEQLDAVILDHLRRLSDRADDGWSTLEPILERVEARSTEAHLLLRAEPLFGGDHPELAFEDLQRRLREGERAMFETREGDLVRIVLPMRLAFRGGRTWIVDHQGRAARRLKRQDVTLAAALKSAHRIMNREGLNPSDISADARAPANAYERKLCQLALLSPNLQQMILDGRQPEGLNLQALIDADPPLSWVDQEAWLVRLSWGAAPSGIA
jgi:site-specific DNA recombinase